MDDAALLEKFAANGSSEAFETLRRRHIDWVWSAARRQVPEVSMADDVMQAVFIILAKKSASLAKLRRPLVPWLFKVVRYTCSEARRSQNRRHYHESRAAAMKSEVAEPIDSPGWEELAPVLDELVARLPAADRHALLLRFYRSQSLAEVGEALGSTEEAARKRISRAIEKLRHLFAQRGIAITGPALSTALIPHVTTGAPVLAMSATGSHSASSLAERTLQIMTMLKMKLAAACVIGVVVIGTGSALIATSLLQAQSTTTPATAPAAAGLIAEDDLIEVAITDLIGPGVVTRVPRRIGIDGVITLPPMRQPIRVLGLTLDQVEVVVAEAYRTRNLIRNPTVDVTRVEEGARASAPSQRIASLDYVKIMIGDLVGPGQEHMEILRLTDQGNITLPLAGELKLVGMTEIEAERAITAAYNDKNLIRNAMVWVLRMNPDQAKAEMERKSTPAVTQPAAL